MQQTKPQMFLPFAMFFVASFFYLYEFLLRVVPSVMKPQLSMEFSIGAKEYGILAAIYYLSYAPLQLPVGAWIDRFGTRRLLTLAITICGVSTLLSSYTQNYYIALLARFLIGAGSAFGFISCMKVLAVWFPPRWFPVMTGFTLTIGTMGAAASWPISIAMNYIDWRELLFILGIVGILTAIVAWLVIRDDNPHAHRLHAKPPAQAHNFWECLWKVAKQPQSWLVGFYAFLTTAPTDAFGGAWGVPFLTDSHGIDKDTASAAQAMVFVGMAIGSPFLGWLAKWRSPKVPMIFAALVATLALSLLIYLPHITPFIAGLLFFIFGAFGTYVLSFVVIRQITRLEYVGTAVGFVNMLSMIGSMLLTSSIGWILDRVRAPALLSNDLPAYLWSDYKIGLMALPIFYAVAAFLVIPFIHDRAQEGEPHAE